jgi:hypothetical protein
VSAGYLVGGFISRSNMSPPQDDLPIQADPYWNLLGGTSADASMTSSEGVMAGLSVHKQVWANSAYVAGQQLVLATPDNSTLDLRLLIDGDSQEDMQSKAATIIAAVTQQMTYEVSLTYDTAIYAWLCYTADYQVAFNQLGFFGNLLPLYITAMRDPTPLSGPV